MILQCFGLGPVGYSKIQICQLLQMANIKLGHLAYQASPGPFLPVLNQSLFFISQIS